MILSAMLNRILTAALASILFCLTIAPGPAVAEDWPQFLGPRRDGTSLETGLLDKFPEGGPKILWQKDVGTGYSAPSIREGQLVYHHRLGFEEIVECVDAATGKEIWRYGYGSRYRDPFGYNNGPRCTPLVTDKYVYVYGAEGMLYCLDFKTGRKVWSRNTATDWNVPQPFFGIGSTPILEGDLLIVMVGGQPNSAMVAFNAKTGETVWENIGKDTWNGSYKLGWPGTPPVRWTGTERLSSYATPVAATIHGKRHILCMLRQGLVSIDPKDGAFNFKRWFRAQVNDSVNAMNPVVVDDMILISAAYYSVGSVLLKVNEDGKGFEEAWSTAARRKQDRSRDPALEIHWTTPIVHDGFVYAFSGRNEPDARFRCVDVKAGTVKWDRDESWQKGRSKTPDVYGRGSAIMAEGKLIILGEGGLLGLVKVNSEKLEEISRWQVPKFHHPCWAAPVLSQKKVYLRSEDQLLCLDFAKQE
jgi:outer membrane protein assembly factor BamB